MDESDAEVHIIPTYRVVGGGEGEVQSELFNRIVARRLSLKTAHAQQVGSVLYD